MKKTSLISPWILACICDKLGRETQACPNEALCVVLNISLFYLLVLPVLYGIETSKTKPFNEKSSNVYDSVCVHSEVISVNVSGVGKLIRCMHVSGSHGFMPVRIPLSIPEWPTAACVSASHSSHRLEGLAG